MFLHPLKRLSLGCAILLMVLLTACGPAATATPATAVSAPPAENAPTTAASGLATEPAPTAAVAPTTEPASTAVSAIVTVTKLNLNTVTGDELLNTIPGFGNRMVREFQEYRPYVSIQQFRREIGKYVDEAQIAEYEKYVYVPINFNEADAATLQQIPGLTEAEAANLIAARPFASSAAFLAKLAEFANADEVAVAQAYLSTP